MKSLLRNTLSLLAFSVIVLGAGYLIMAALKLHHLTDDYVLLTALFSLIALTSFIIFLRGQSREPHSRTMHTFVSVSLKFLLELLLTAVWFIIAKKTSPESVLMFFVLYLTFSLFLILNILKALKNKSL